MLLLFHLQISCLLAIVRQIISNFLGVKINSVVSETFQGTLSTSNLVIGEQLNSELWLLPLISTDFCPAAINALSLLLYKLLKLKGTNAYREPCA